MMQKTLTMMTWRVDDETKYENVPLFPVRCFNFKASDALVEDTLEKVKKLDYRRYNEPEGVGTSNDIHANPQFRGLHDWFQQCIDTLHADNGWQCDRIVVNKSWVNRSDAEKGEHHAPHRHPMSYLSGIFYLTEGPPTVFLDPHSIKRVATVSFRRRTYPRQSSIHPQWGGWLLYISFMVGAC